MTPPSLPLPKTCPCGSTVDTIPGTSVAYIDADASRYAALEAELAATRKRMEVVARVAVEVERHASHVEQEVEALRLLDAAYGLALGHLRRSERHHILRRLGGWAEEMRVERERTRSAVGVEWDVSAAAAAAFAEAQWGLPGASLLASLRSAPRSGDASERGEGGGR